MLCNSTCAKADITKTDTMKMKTKQASKGYSQEIHRSHQFLVQSLVTLLPRSNVEDRFATRAAAYCLRVIISQIRVEMELGSCTDELGRVERPCIIVRATGEWEMERTSASA